jgi:hypothetical protein
VGWSEIRRKLGNGTENCVAEHYIDVIRGAVTSCYELGCWTYSMLWKALEVKAALPMSTDKSGIMIIQEREMRDGVFRACNYMSTVLKNSQIQATKPDKMTGTKKLETERAGEQRNRNFSGLEIGLRRPFGAECPVVKLPQELRTRLSMFYLSHE